MDHRKVVLRLAIARFFEFPQDLMAKGRRFKPTKLMVGMFLVAQNWLGISTLPCASSKSYENKTFPVTESKKKTEK